MGTVSVGEFGCFGKLPVSREFLVEGSAEVSATGFDTFVGEGMAMAKAPLGDSFKDRALGFPSHDFAWSGRGIHEYSFFGKIQASQDGAGRIHPFAAFARVKRQLSHTGDPLHPIRLAGVAGTLQTLSASTSEKQTSTEVVDMIRAADVAVSEEISFEASEYDRYVRSRTVSDLFQDVLGSGSDPLRYQIMQALVETIEYLRGRAPIDIRMGIRIPLSGGGPAAAMEISYWIKMISSLLRSPVDGCCYFWTAGATNSGWRPFLHFFFSQPGSAQWISLIDPNADVETISYLDRPYGTAPEERMDPDLRQLLDNGESRLNDCLEWAKNA